MTSRNRWQLATGTVVMALVVTSFAFPPRQEKQPKVKLVTLHGTVVDFYSYMTGQGAAAAKSEDDHLKLTRESIKNGVPACLETDDALIVLGKGAKGAVELVMPLAGQEVEVRGKLYEKDGMQFMDLVAIKAAQPEEKEGEPQAEEPEEGEAEAEGEEP